MIEGLVGGQVYGSTEQRTGRTGEFTVATVRAISKGEAVFVNVIAYDLMAQVSLLALDDGDAVRLVGRLTPRARVDRDGEARASLGMTATQVLTAYQAKRKRDALAALPEDDEAEEWLQGAPA